MESEVPKLYLRTISPYDKSRKYYFTQPLIRLVINCEILEIADLALSLITQLIYHSYIILLTSFRPAPMVWHSLMLGHASGAGHSLPGAYPLDPLVHIFNPSFGTHV